MTVSEMDKCRCSIQRLVWWILLAARVGQVIYEFSVSPFDVTVIARCKMSAIHLLVPAVFLTLGVTLFYAVFYIAVQVLFHISMHSLRVYSSYFNPHSLINGPTLTRLNDCLVGHMLAASTWFQLPCFSLLFRSLLKVELIYYTKAFSWKKTNRMLQMGNIFRNTTPLLVITRHFSSHQQREFLDFIW